MRLYVFDDAAADRWHPFALTRPACELRFGTRLLRERLEAFAGARAAGILTRRSWLSSFSEEWAPPVVPLEEVPEEAPRLLLSSRFVPELRGRLDPPDGRAALAAGGRVVGAYLPAGEPVPDGRWLANPGELDGAETRRLAGEVLEEVWELITRNPDRIRRDLTGGTAPGGAPPELEVLGDEPVRVGDGCRLEPGVVVDARDGPVALADRVEVRAGSRLEGPLYLGSESRVLGGSLGRSSAGPYSYLHGEVEESVVLGHTNKSHAGFLGHSYLGRWVNLGALTTNSDLKNNYGAVRLAGPAGDRETGVQKLGVLLGDHAKTGIGTLLPCGGAVGAGSNLFGGGTAPKWVPPFAWGEDEPFDVYRKEAFLDTAEHVMSRRGVALGASGRRWLAAAWERARGG